MDGTLTDGRLYFDSEGNELKSFSVLDGQGPDPAPPLRLPGRADHRAAQPYGAEARGRPGLETHIGVKDKLSCMDALAARHGLDRARTAFVGDDLPDLDCLRAAGLAVAPANAHPWIAETVHWRTRARAGEGAVREVCDVLLAAQGHVPAILAGAGHGSRDGRSA